MNLLKSRFNQKLGDELEKQFLESKIHFTPEDEMQINGAVNHYARFCDVQLYESLNWKNKFRYQIWDRPQRLLDFLGVLVIVGGATKASRAAFNAMRTKTPKTS